MSLTDLAKTEIKLPALRRRPDASPKPEKRTRRSGRLRAPSAGRVVGLDIEPGEVVAAQVRLNGQIVVERVAAATIDDALVRGGEIADPDALGAWLKDFFAKHDLPRLVRIGVNSPRAVMRVIDLPPLTEAADIEAAIRLQAPEHIAMPLDRAVLDHQVIGPVTTSAGPRTRVVVVAAQRDMVDRILTAADAAGLHVLGIDLSAFALTRAMYDPAASGDEPVLYAHVAGVTTLAIARRATCEMSRISPIGLEQLAARLAEREATPAATARLRLLEFDPDAEEVDEQALGVLDSGLADLADEMSKTLEFHADQRTGAPVRRAIVTGPAATIPNFTDVLGQRVGIDVRPGAPASADDAGDVPLERAALAAGLAIQEVQAS